MKPVYYDSKFIYELFIYLKRGFQLGFASDHTRLY